jgi:hypothetical protein
LQTEFENLLLAFNLILCRICVTSSSKFSKYNIKKKIHKSKSKSKYVVLKKDNKVFINVIGDHILVTDSVDATVPHSASLDERSVIEAFQKLQKIKRFDINKYSSIQDNNLNNSLKNYENAMLAHSKILKYKHLFNALEIVININGSNIKYSNFDNEVSSLCRMNSQSVERWRQF